MQPTEYNVFTLVDITDTNESNPKGGTLPYKQAQNLSSIVQCLSMRSQPLYPKVSVLQDQDLSDYDFGLQYTGLATVWRMYFTCEIENAWQHENDRVYFAMSDIDNVPIYIGLDESIHIYEQTLIASGRSKNIYLI
jgi:hypothetical protein